MIHFKPRVGDKYGSGDVEGLKLLVLGESHYGGADANLESLTDDVIARHLSGKQREGFFSLWSGLLSGKPPFSKLNGDEVIQSVAFYNFVQSLAGSQHDNRPTNEMWDAAAISFCRILDEVKPDAVLVLGQATWNHIRFESGCASEPTDGRDEQRTWTRPDGRRIVATWINHPKSHGFSPSEWERRVATFLERALGAAKARTGEV